MNKFYLFTISLLICLAFVSCKKEKDPVTEAKKELVVEKDEGFCATHDFPNNTWTFPKKELKNGDITIDKTLSIKGILPDCSKRYDLFLIIDFLPNIETNTLPIDFTTITPKGTSKQSCSLKVDFNDKERVKDINLPDGSACKRYSYAIYNQKKFTENGEYTFDLYSKYSKLSLYGIKSIHIKLVENETKTK